MAVRLQQSSRQPSKKPSAGKRQLTGARTPQLRTSKRRRTTHASALPPVHFPSPLISQSAAGFQQWIGSLSPLRAEMLLPFVYTVRSRGTPFERRCILQCGYQRQQSPLASVTPQHVPQTASSHQ